MKRNNSMKEGEIKRVGTLPDMGDLKDYLKEKRVPAKFHYFGEGADAWQKLRESKSYQLGKGELSTFEEGISRAKNFLGDKPFNIIHLGPGNGIEIPFLFEAFDFSESNSYVGVDISEDMIKSAINLQSEYLSNSNVLWYNSDIEKEGNLEKICSEVKEIYPNTNVVIAPNEGSLFSNKEMFKIIYNSLDFGDYFYANLEGDGSEKRDEICKTYDLEETKNLLSLAFKKTGYDTRKGRFYTIFNEKESQTETYFKAENGQEIFCLASYKPKKEEFKQRLFEAGFDIEFLNHYEENNSIAALCKKEESK